jgi:hypothetical protein
MVPDQASRTQGLRCHTESAINESSLWTYQSKYAEFHSQRSHKSVMADPSALGGGNDPVGINSRRSQTELARSMKLSSDQALLAQVWKAGRTEWAVAKVGRLGTYIQSTSTMYCRGHLQM